MLGLEFRRNFRSRRAALITLIYLVAAGTWIVVSDLLLANWVDLADLSAYQTYKGWLFVAITTVGLYWLIRNAFRSIESSEQALLATNQTLRRTEERFRRAVLHAPFPVIIHAEDGEVLQINNAWTELSGYTIEEISTISDWNKKAHAAPKDDVRRGIGKLYRLDRRVDDGEFAVTTKAGMTRSWEFSSAPLGKLPDGRRAVISMAVDVTERKRLESQFLQSQKMEVVGRLANSVAHDFNNLLTIILGYSDSLLAQSDGNTPERVAATEIKAAGERAAALTSRLLAFSRRQPVRPRVLDVNNIIAGMESMVRRLIGANILLETSLYPDLWPVKADPGQMEQVMMNLAINARDAMPKGGRLLIATGNLHGNGEELQQKLALPPGEHVVLAVHDSGEGIDPKILPNIFEPFFTTKEHGSGLGLSTVHGIVRQCGGEIRVESRPGLGTKFFVCLPRSDA
jgi:PAS domain S-box-containing protein